jgi:hypothetical protein
VKMGQTRRVSQVETASAWVQVSRVSPRWKPAILGFLWICWSKGYWPLAQAGGKLLQRLLRLVEVSALERTILR